MTRGIDTLLAELQALRREQRARATSTQLDHSSLEDASLPVKDGDGRTTAIYGKQFDDTYTAASVAGPPPPQPSAPTVDGAVAGLTVTWDGMFADANAVAPMDFVRVDVHTSMTSGFDAVATQPRYSFNSPRGGSCYVPLIDGTHYVALVTRTESGRASAQSTEAAGTARKISGDDISGDLVYPGDIPIDQITSGILNAVIQTSESGPRVRLSDLYGLQVIDENESAVVDFPADGSRPAQITGELIARSLTALGNLSIRNTGNEIAASGDLRLASGVIAPIASPTTSMHYDSLQLDQPPESNADAVGLAYGGDSWWRAVNVVQSGVASDRVDQLGADGHLVASIDVAGDPRYGVTYLNGVVHVLMHPYNTPDYQINVYRYDAATGTNIGNWRYTYTGALYYPAIGHDGTNLAIARVSESGLLYLRRMNPAVGVDVVDVLQLRDRPSSFGPHLRGVYVGQADFGEETIVVADTTGTVLAWDTNGNRVPRAWYQANNQPLAGLTWDGERFWSVRGATSVIYGFSGIVNPDGETDDWWVANTWCDSVGHETEIGPPTRFSMRRRASLIVTTPPLPTGADSVCVYLARSTSTPARTTYTRIGDHLTGTLRLNTIDRSGTQPPETNTFPDSTPALLHSSRGQLAIRGDGTLSAPRKIQSGQVTITPSKANTPTAYVVTFPVPFQQTPHIVAAPYTSVPGTNVTGVGVDAPSISGCTIWLTRTNTATTSVYWIAVAPD